MIRQEITKPNKEIIIEAFVTDPNKGSEAGVAWRLIVALSKSYHLHVVTQSFHGNEQRINAHLVDYPLSNVDFYFIPLNPTALWHRWPFNYLLYHHWHLMATKFIAKQFADQDIQIIHKINTIGYRIPGFSYLLSKYNFIWGPIDGLTNVDTHLLAWLPLRGKIYYLMYNILNTIECQFSPIVSLAKIHSHSILAATQDTYQYLQKILPNKPIYYVREVSTDKSMVVSTSNIRPKSHIVIAWSGLFIYRKNLILLLRALANIQSQTTFHLHILGDGLLHSYYQQQAIILGIADRIDWHGWVDRQEAIKIVSNAHLFVLTSIRECNNTAMFEAIANGIPVVAIRTSGMKDTINERIGHLIDIDIPDIMINQLSQIILIYAQELHLWEQKHQNVLKEAHSRYHTERLVEIIAKIYEDIYR